MAHTNSAVASAAARIETVATKFAKLEAAQAKSSAHPSPANTATQAA